MLKLKDWPSPTSQWPWDSWPCPSLNIAAEELTLALGRDGPTPHYRHVIAGHNGLGLGELALALTWEDSPSVSDWPDQLWLRLIYCVWNWSTLTSTLSMTCWNAWRDWSWGTIATGSPWFRTPAGYLKRKEGPMKMVSQRPWTKLMTHCNEHFGWSWLNKRLYYMTHHSSRCH